MEIIWRIKFMKIIDATYILVPVDTLTNLSSNLFFLLIENRIFIAGYLSEGLKSFKMSRYFSDSLKFTTYKRKHKCKEQY